MSTLSVTLSRAHKIATRLSQHLAELQQKAEEAALPVALRAYPNEAAVDRIHKANEACLTTVARAREVSVIIASIRAAIGQANQAGETPIGDLLAQAEAAKRQLNLLNAVLTAAKGGVPQNELDVAMWRTQDALVARAPEVRVASLSEASLAVLDAQRAEAQRELYALTDKLAELNARRIALQLPEDLANLALGA